METKKTPNIKQQEKKSNTVFFKKYWHIIVICVLLLLFMGQCTKSCSRNQKINVQNVELAKCDSIIDNLEFRIDTLSNSLNYYTALYNSERSHNYNFASIATGNQNELYNQMNELNAQILSLQNENIGLDRTIKNIERENKILRDSLSYYKEELNKKIEK